MTKAVEEGPSARREFHLEVEEEGADAVSLLAAATGLGRGRVKRAMACGALWLERNGRVARLRRVKRRLVAGDRLHLYHDPRILDREPPTAWLVADEGDWSVWCKPPGMFSQGSRWGDHWSIARFAEQRLQRSAFLVHRLDRAASGLILVAHGRKTAAALSRLFRERRVEKRYRVVVHGCFPGQPQRFDSPLDGRPALTHARLLERDDEAGRSLLEVEIETGRKHQIRRHLAAAGFPVVGDRFHGGGEEEDLRLQCVLLAFPDPAGSRRREYRLPVTEWMGL